MQRHRSGVGILPVLLLAAMLTGCGTGPLIGLVYTDVRLPLTRNLDTTALPDGLPASGRVVEIKEPFSGLGIYARMSVDAIGDIARQNDIEPLHFADQEVFSVLGVWKTRRVILYGEAAAGSGTTP